MNNKSLLLVATLAGIFGMFLDALAQRTVSPTPIGPIWEMQRDRLGIRAGGGVALSPDGKAVVLMGEPESPAPGSPSLNASLLLVELETGRRTVLRPSDNSGIPSSPSFSPDGKQVVFVLRGFTHSYPTDIYSVGIDGRGLTKLTESQLYTNKPPYGEPGYTGAMYQRYYSSPRFSPDGSKILLSVSDEVGRKYLTAVMKPDGSDLEILAEGLPCCWSADGKAIYLRQTGALTRMDLVTRQTRTLPPPSIDRKTPMSHMAGREWLAYLLDNGRIGWYNFEAPRIAPEFVGEWSVPGTKTVGAEELTLKGFEWSQGYDILLWYQGEEMERFEVVRIAEPASLSR